MLLERPAYKPLWGAARRRLESNGVSLEGTPLKLKGLTSDEADAIAGLLGVPRPGDGSVRVTLTHLDDCLRSSVVGQGLVEVLSALGGPVEDRRARRERTRSRGHGPGRKFRLIAPSSSIHAWRIGSNISVRKGWRGGLLVTEKAKRSVSPSTPLRRSKKLRYKVTQAFAFLSWPLESPATRTGSIVAGPSGHWLSTPWRGSQANRFPKMPQIGAGCGRRRGWRAMTSRATHWSSTSQDGRPSRSASRSDRSRPGRRSRLDMALSA